MMRKIKTAVITGPTGAIGIALCNLLLKNGIKVYAVCRPDSSRASNLPDGVIKIDCDLGELDTLKNKIDSDADVFYHFGWANTTGSGRNDMYSQNLNVKYTLDAVHAAKDLGCKVFIGSGSQAEYGRVDGTIRPDTPCFPENGYGMAKLCAGRMSRVECEKLGIDFVWTRILSVYGPYDGQGSMISTVIRKLLNGEKPSLTAGTQMWDYVYSDDAAKAFYLMAQCGVCGKTYIIAGGHSMPLKNYVEILRNTIGPELPLGFGEVEAANPVSLTADIALTTEDTGFVPEISFEDGIARTIDYIKNINTVGK